MKARPTLRITDMLSEAGHPARVNEDAAGGNGCSAFVIDGATGLGDKSIVGLEGSDAAWLARLAKTFFEQKVTPAHGMQDLVRTLNQQAAMVVLGARGGLPIAPWSLPIAGFQLVRVEGNALVVYGLGDCRLFLTGGDGRTVDTTPLRGSHLQERDSARLAMTRAGGLAAVRSLADDPAVRDELRRHRAGYNREGASVWTLGTEPAAAKHLAVKRLPVAHPASGLLCTDGFAALCDQYGRYSPAEMIATAKSAGLKAMLSELRRIERIEDPDGRLYPRFKVSDDATALLFELVA
jgi:hypothetical protein